MTMVETTEVFGFYEVNARVMDEYAGKSLHDLIADISDLSVIRYDNPKEKLNLILAARQKKDGPRLRSLCGLLFNLLGIADGVEIEDAFAWKDHDHKEGG